MIELNGKNYNLYLFDTNALSSFLQKPKAWLNYFNDVFSFSNTVICYSVFTLSEFWYRKDLFDKYLDFFSAFPSAILDGHESIFLKEVENYNQFNKINPIVVVPFAITGSDLKPKEKLKKVIEDSSFVSKTEYWKKGQKDVLDGVVSLIKNYPPKKDQYTIKEIEDFNFIVSTSQIGLRNNKFAKNIIKSGSFIDLNQFPSIRTTSYVVFYKFYPDKRKPILSDIFDIIISSILPYVDLFITEGNMCEIIKRIQNKHVFLKGLKQYSIKEINKEIDDYA